MSTFPHRVALGVAAFVLATSGPAFAQLKITFVAPDSTVPADCMATMDATQKKFQVTTLDVDITWTLDGPTCPDFDPSKVQLVFASDAVDTHFWSHRHLAGDSGSKSVKGHITKDKKKAKPHTVHPYFILYNDLFAGDPEIDINCDVCDTGVKK